MAGPTEFISGDDNVPAVDGEHSGLGTAVVGNSVRGAGVHGVNDAPQGSSVKPDSGAGVWGESTNGFGVFGSSDNNVGVKGIASHSDGLQGISLGADNFGTSGYNRNGGVGVFGESTGNDGVQGNSQDPGHSGVAGFNQNGGTGVFGKSIGGGRGIWGVGTPAGHFDGDVEVTGDLVLTGKLFGPMFRETIDFSAARIFNKGISFSDAPVVFPTSVVMVSLTEIDSNGDPFLGLVTMKVYNVVPGGNQITIRGEVDSDDPINVRATILIANLPTV